jgi:glycosyltransferase involved in cell wall biosynthesis
VSTPVTVVVTNFNYGRYVEEAVASALGQHGGPPRVVVVDDGSTEEESEQALDRLSALGGVEVVRQANAGAAAARNAGLRLAATPYVLALDADDRLAAGALAVLAGALDAHPEAGFAYGHQEFFGDMGGVMRLPAYDGLKLLDRHLIGPSALMRAEVVADTGGFDPAFELYEDWELWVNALAHGWRGVRVDAVTHEYRRQAVSKLARDRRRYHAFRRQLRAKHSALFARRAELREDSEMGPLARAAYRAYWGPRPLPAGLEDAVYRRLFRSRDP